LQLTLFTEKITGFGPPPFYLPLDVISFLPSSCSKSRRNVVNNQNVVSTGMEYVFSFLSWHLPVEKKYVSAMELSFFIHAKSKTNRFNAAPQNAMLILDNLVSQHRSFPLCPNLNLVL